MKVKTPSLTRQLSHRDQVAKVDKDLPALERTPGLDSELDKLRTLLDRLTVEYKNKKELMDTSISPNNTGQKQRHTTHLCTHF